MSTWQALIPADAGALPLLSRLRRTDPGGRADARTTREELAVEKRPEPDQLLALARSLPGNLERRLLSVNMPGAARSLLASLALLVVGCADTTISASDFSQECAADSECGLVYSGDVCAFCGSSNDAVAARSLDAYHLLFERLQKQCLFENTNNCETSVVARCVDRSCTISLDSDPTIRPAPSDRTFLCAKGEAPVETHAQCNFASECETAAVRVDCAGSVAVTGTRGDTRAALEEASAACFADPCPGDPLASIADDGTHAEANEAPAVECIDGVCTTSFGQ